MKRARSVRSIGADRPVRHWWTLPGNTATKKAATSAPIAGLVAGSATSAAPEHELRRARRDDDRVLVEARRPRRPVGHDDPVAAAPPRQVRRTGGQQQGREQPAGDRAERSFRGVACSSAQSATALGPAPASPAPVGGDRLCARHPDALPGSRSTMSDLPVFTLEDLERMPRFEVPSFDNDAAVSLGEVAVEVIRERGLNLAVRIMVSGDVVFVAKLGTHRSRQRSVAARQGARRREVRRAVAARPASPRGRRHAVRAARRRRSRRDARARRVDPDLRRAASVAGSITMSGEPDVVDHDAAAETLRRYLAR